MKFFTGAEFLPQQTKQTEKQLDITWNLIALKRTNNEEPAQSFMQSYMHSANQLVNIFSTIDSVLLSISAGCFDVIDFSTSFNKSVLKNNKIFSEEKINYCRTGCNCWIYLNRIKYKIMIHFFTKQIIPDKFVYHFVKIENLFFPLGLSYFKREEFVN